jgi:hypothetical protein
MSQQRLQSRRRFPGFFGTLKAWTSACVVTGGALACGSTPLDSVVADVTNRAGTEGGGASAGSNADAGTGGLGASGGKIDGGSGGSGGTGGANGGIAGGAGASDCQSDVPTPGLYQVRDRATDRCLQKGADDPTLHPVYHALLDADCSVPEAKWELREIVPNFYAVYNTGIDANLDVRAGATTDGTLLVLYKPQPQQNQLFRFLPRTPPYFALEPQNAVNKCVEAVGSGAQLFPCEDANQAQDFNLVRVDCP